MSKDCKKCGKKIGFFEKVYEDRYCKECYEEIKRNEIEIERKKKQEQIAKEEKIALEKINSARDYFLYTCYYYKILDKIDSIPFHYNDIFNGTVKNKFDIIKVLFFEIIKQLPEDFNLNDIKKITTYRQFSKIIDLSMKPYVKRELNYKNYCKILVENQGYSKNPNNNILDDIEINSDLIYVGGFINFQEDLLNAFLESEFEVIDNLQKYINDWIKKSNNSNDKYDYNECIKVANEFELEQTYRILYIYYYYAVRLVYYILFNKVVDRIINISELYKIYNKLKVEIHNENYIIQKLFSIYNSLYKNDFDIIFDDEQEFSILIESIKFRNKIVNKNDYVDINTNILNLDINKYVNNTNDDDIIYSIYDEVFFNISSYAKYLSIDDIFDIFFYSKRVLKIYKEIKRQQAFNEKERILNDNFEKEKTITNDLLDYSLISNGYEFENFVANLYKMLGYSVLDITSKSGDQGADVIIEKDSIKYAIQVKYYNNPVGNKAIQEVVAAKSYYKTDKAMVVTNSTYTKQAQELAKANDVILVDGVKLEQLKNEIKK